MLVSDFQFDLPAELIAQHPPAKRGSSRMLLLDRRTGALTDETFQSLPQLLRPGDLLILNDSRVLPARLFATRGGLTTQVDSPAPSGVIEVLLTQQVEDSGEPTSQERDVGHPILWKALVKPARKVRVGERLYFFGEADSRFVDEEGERGILEGGERAFHIPGAKAHFRSGAVMPGLKSRPISETDVPVTPVLTAEVIAAGEFGERTLRFGAVEDFYERVGRIGHMPLPPYIRREQAGQPDSVEDRERYQTVYSVRPGSAAAPTAGLHFTPEILAELEARGVEVQYLTLHVGLGTFQPVRVETLEEIRLHSERYTLPAATADALNRALADGRRIVAVGTTTTRTLEHIAAKFDSRNGPQGLKPAGYRAFDGTGKPVPLSKTSFSANYQAETAGVEAEERAETEFVEAEERTETAGVEAEERTETAGVEAEWADGTLGSHMTADFAGIEPHSGATSIFLAPGHRFRLVSGLLTNFHLPESTLLMLVSAFAAQDGQRDRGRKMVLNAYAHAIREHYRFYSYGDCMLLL